ncbi:hypothetical protein HY285_00800 [Candidatus Peregrinibacteria bacterium]|nr:hypothetical protein [Candidatus Peregrinibacteria bacterium]MBI3816068.1 hypothetical protein [Candidatus Peregrinibacteria bacterium]
MSYTDLKHFVCDQANSRDGTDEATFCHKLKGRIKTDHHIALIDRLIQTDRKSGGYLLLREADLVGK